MPFLAQPGRARTKKKHEPKWEITNYKPQITNKFKIQSFKIQNKKQSRPTEKQEARKLGSDEAGKTSFFLLFFSSAFLRSSALPRFLFFFIIHHSSFIIHH